MELPWGIAKDLVAFTVAVSDSGLLACVSVLDPGTNWHHLHSIFAMLLSERMLKPYCYHILESSIKSDRMIAS